VAKKTLLHHGHVMISGGDIADLLKLNGHGTVATVSAWLQREFKGLKPIPTQALERLRASE
jgi:hypothetical protein